LTIGVKAMLLEGVLMPLSVFGIANACRLLPLMPE
jgi:hypothetical protein